MKLTLGHSPDSDDAFMFYALAHDLVETGEYEFEHILRDIETLNRWAVEGTLHTTAISVHGYAFVADKYAIMTHGASMGDGYGPMVIAREEMSDDELRRQTIAIPGLMTSAYLALRLRLGDVHCEVLDFDEILPAVVEGRYAAGLIIHEGQLTHEEEGARCLMDLGAWWKGETGLPLPLGVNVIRRDLGPKRMAAVSRILHASIQYSLHHREEALDYALEFGRGLDRAQADKFVGMYVNDWTLDMGEAGQRSIRMFLERGAAAGVVENLPPIDFVD